MENMDRIKVQIKVLRSAWGGVQVEVQAESTSYLTEFGAYSAVTAHPAL